MQTGAKGLENVFGTVPHFLRNRPASLAMLAAMRDASSRGERSIKRFKES